MRAKIRRCALGVLLLVPLFFAQGTQTQAAIVQTDINGVTDILNLTVGTETVNIRFVFATYNDAFPGGNLYSNAATFVDAINLVLNVPDPPPPISFPDSLSTFSSNFFNIPISLDGVGGFNTSRGLCPATVIGGFIVCTELYAEEAFLFTPFAGGSTAWAVPSSVPLPAALPLFGSALAMLGIVGWRRKKRGHA